MNFPVTFSFHKYRILFFPYGTYKNKLDLPLDRTNVVPKHVPEVNHETEKYDSMTGDWPGE